LSIARGWWRRDDDDDDDDGISSRREQCRSLVIDLASLASASCLRAFHAVNCLSRV
jgi:hypothetical protein